MSRQQRRAVPQLASRVPGVISGPNSLEEQRLRRSLLHLEQQRISQEASDAAWLRSFAVRQTLHLQTLHRLGFTKSLDLLPDCLLTDYGDSLMSVAKQPLLGRITTLAQQQKRMKRERDGVHRSVSLGDSGSSDLLVRSVVTDTDEQRSVSESRASSSSASRLPSLFSSMNSQQPIGSSLESQPIGTDNDDQPITEMDFQPTKVQKVVQPMRGEQVAQPMRGEQVAQPMRSNRASQPIKAPLRLPQLDPRFLRLVDSLERKSAWKRRYVPPPTQPGGGQSGNSLEELVNSYYSK